jgi:hypothetical protein
MRQRQKTDSELRVWATYASKSSSSALRVLRELAQAAKISRGNIF